MKKPRKLIELIKTVFANTRLLLKTDEKLDTMLLNQGRMLAVQNESRTSTHIRDYEFKVFSQWGEDGILQFLTRAVEIKNRTFIEFGVEDFMESNCRFLLMKDNWQGFVIDGSGKKIRRLQNSNFYWKYHIQGIAAFITRENINSLLAQSGFDRDLGILSIDIDGNDYYVLDVIDAFTPRILICEFNALFGSRRDISIPYRSDFQRTGAHFSNLYFGASLKAMTRLAESKGYVLVGTTSASNNAFYVRKDLMTPRITPLTVEEAYTPSNVRESRDHNGMLTYVTGDKRLVMIKGLPVFDFESNALSTL